MHDHRHGHALEAAVERGGAVVEDLLVVAGHRRLIELEQVAAGGLQIEQLGIDGGGDVHRHLAFVLVGVVERTIDHRHRSGERHLHRPVGVGLGEFDVVDGRRPSGA